MIDVNALRGRIAEKGLSQAKMAEKLGIAPKTFYEKMSKGVFGSDEIECMIDELDKAEHVRVVGQGGFSSNVRSLRRQEGDRDGRI